MQAGHAVKLLPVDGPSFHVHVYYNNEIPDRASFLEPFPVVLALPEPGPLQSHRSKLKIRLMLTKAHYDLRVRV